MTIFWQDAWGTAFRHMNARLEIVLPRLLAMLMLLVVGLILGAIARTIVVRLARAVDFDARTHAWGLAPGITRAGVRRPASELLGFLAFWGTVAFFGTMAIDALGIPGAPGATEALARFVPRLAVGVLILIAGWIAANWVGQALLISAVNAGVPEARLLARAARWGILLFAVATTLTQIGIGRSMVMLAFAITFGGLVLSLALAFGLGGRALAREILERRLRREPPAREHVTHL
jgi:hypothetical protein